MIITREVQLDVGHRVPDHGSKCRNPHGHRYRVIVAVEGEPIDLRGNVEDGMVIDFGRLAEALDAVVHDPCDHGFIVAEHDRPMRTALSLLRVAEEAKVIVVPFPPTAERLAEWWGGQLEGWLMLHARIRVSSVTVWETPNSSATWTA